MKRSERKLYAAELERLETREPEVLDALREFALRHGSKWRDVLRDLWVCGKDGSTPYLRRARNTLGPLVIGEV